MRPPFPTVLDSSLMSAFRSCPRKLELEYIQHWKAKGKNVHLTAGGAFAAGMEAARTAFWVDGKSAEDATALGVSALIHHYGDYECPPDSAKSLERTAGALEFALQRFPLGEDGTEPITLPGGKRGIEFSFSHPLPIPNPETGEPLLYCGRMDQIVKYQAAGVFIEDDKTTSQLGASWPNQWGLRSQFTGYAWGCREAGIEVKGVLVRGISILKTKYDSAESLTYRPPWMIDRWYAQLLLDVQRMVECWEEGYYDYNLDHACVEYGGCPFRQVCSAQDGTIFLQNFFERRRWDPVTRTETLLEG